MSDFMSEEAAGRGDVEPAGRVRLTRYRDGEFHLQPDTVALEQALDLRVNGKTLVYLMRLPGADVALAVGFCLSEGVIASRDDIVTVSCSTTEAGAASGGMERGSLVEITTGSAADLDRYDPPGVIRTGSGGADLGLEAGLGGVRVESEARFHAVTLLGVPDAMLEQQPLFRSTGGTHGAGLFDVHGRMLVVMEDVGRHNAVDKVLGHLLLSGGDPSEVGLVLSGRLAYEMVLKAARAGIPLVCSVSAPTSLGVEVGEAAGITVVGFLRGAGFNIYSHPERLVAP